MRFDIDIPPGSNATIVLPVALSALREGRGPARQARGVTSAAEHTGASVLTIGSGRYRFEGAA